VTARDERYGTKLSLPPFFPSIGDWSCPPHFSCRKKTDVSSSYLSSRWFPSSLPSSHRYVILRQKPGRGAFPPCFPPFSTHSSPVSFSFFSFFWERSSAPSSRNGLALLFFLLLFFRSPWKNSTRFCFFFPHNLHLILVRLRSHESKFFSSFLRDSKGGMFSFFLFFWETIFPLFWSRKFYSFFPRPISVIAVRISSRERGLFSPSLLISIPLPLRSSRD